MVTRPDSLRSYVNESEWERSREKNTNVWSRETVWSNAKPSLMMLAILLLSPYAMALRNWLWWAIWPRSRDESLVEEVSAAAVVDGHQRGIRSIVKHAIIFLLASFLLYVMHLYGVGNIDPTLDLGQEVGSSFLKTHNLFTTFTFVENLNI